MHLSIDISKGDQGKNAWGLSVGVERREKAETGARPGGRLRP